MATAKGEWSYLIMNGSRCQAECEFIDVSKAGRTTADVSDPSGRPVLAKKDLGAWSIAKGEYEESENPLEAARREFGEETGFVAEGPFEDLGEVKKAGAKNVIAWAFEGDCDPDDLVSNTCQIEWPPHSGRLLKIPEVDRGRWFSVAEARGHMQKRQQPLLDRLVVLF